MVCIKIPPEARETFGRLQANGYGFIEETVKPYQPDLQNSDFDYRKYMKYPLRASGTGDIEKIRGIAYRTFTLDRFHRDRRFSGDKASERYSYWVNNSYHSGEDVLILDGDGAILGFAVVGFTGDGASIGLIGMDDVYKGRGLGMNLLAATCQYVRDKGAKELSTTVSLNNIPALNLYSKCGFKFRDPVYVLHKWM
jgi:ribosomal protein S18 acetylase RimI-like enzyme